jgi:hypothetical protein
MKNARAASWYVRGGLLVTTAIGPIRGQKRQFDLRAITSGLAATPDISFCPFSVRGESRMNCAQRQVYSMISVA